MYKVIQDTKNHIDPNAVISGSAELGWLVTCDDAGLACNLGKILSHQLPQADVRFAGSTVSIEEPAQPSSVPVQSEDELRQAKLDVLRCLYQISQPPLKQFIQGRK